MGYFTRSSFVRAALAAFSLSLLFAGPSFAADFTIDAVADAGDNNPGDGYCDSILAGFDCTLRAAVQEANALAGPDTVFIPNLFLVVNLVGADDAAIAGDFDVTDDLEITGSLFTTLMSIHSEPLFELRSGTLKLEEMSLYDGGIETLTGTALEVVDVDLDRQILNRGRGRLLRTSIVGSPQRAIENEGVLTISDSLVANNGSDLLTVGGIDNFGVLTVDRTEISYNVGHDVGGIGGLLNRASGVASVSNSKFVGNLGAMTDANNLGWMRWSHVTLFGGACLTCSFGIRNTGVFEVQNSRLSTGPIVCADAITSLGYNTISDGSCLTVLGPGDAENSMTFQDRVPAELCAPLTLAGNTRPAGETCDSGAEDLGHDDIACGNGLDDDGDGFVDLQDPGCRDVADPLEAHIRPGDFVIANFDTGGVTVFDPVTTRLFPIARGSAVSPYDILADDDGAIHVSDSTLASLTAVDVEEGGSHLVSAGDQLQSPTGIDQNWLGEWFVGDQLSEAIFEIDPQTGVQSLITNHPDLGDIDDILRRPGSGSLFVSDTGSGIRMVTDPLGSPSVYTIATTTITVPRQLAFDSAFDLVIADSGDNIPAWKDLQSIAETPLLTAPAFTNMQGAAVEPSGLSLFTDYDTGEIKRVDEGADTATTLNLGREEPGINHMALVPSAADLTLTLSDGLVVDGGTAGVADVGDTLELTAVVTNVGAVTANLLSLESGLDPNLTLVAGQLTTTQGTIGEGSLASDPRLEVDLGNLAPAATATVTWQVDVADPAPARFVTANAWVRRDRLILVESDDPGTGPVGDRTVIGVGDYGVVVGASQKISDIRGGLSGVGNPGTFLADTSQFGRGPAALGDFDGDGRKEIVVGAHKANAGLGAVYLLDLAPDGTVVETKEVGPVTGLLPGEEFGYKVASLGDLDGAGPSAAAIAVTSFRPLTFAVHILFLDAQGDVIPGTQKIISHGAPAGLTVTNVSAFGFALANLGDLDGAGPAAAALAVGAPASTGADGFVYIFFLDSAGNVLSSPAFQKIGYASGGMTQDPGLGVRFGHGLAFLGNIDAGPAPEIAVSAIWDPSDTAKRGAVWILSLNSDGTVFGEWKIDHNDPALTGQLEDDDELGIALTSLHFDADGIPEIVATARGDDDGALNAGAAYVLWLDPSLQSAAKVRKISATTGAFFGDLEESDYLQEVRAIGDLDGDGVSELAVGVPFHDDTGADRGALHILYPVTPVPEPGQTAMLLAGIVLLGTLGRGRGRRGPRRRRGR